MSRIAVSGYYGCGNTGDEAVLAGIVESFARRAGPDTARFTVFSANPAETARLHGLAAVDRMDRRAVRRAIEESDLLLSGGGSLVQDTTSLRSLIYYLWIIRLGLSYRKPVMLYAQGIGQLRRRIARTITRIVIDRVQMITVRDPESRDLLQRIGVRRPPIEVTADPAFALTPGDPARAVEILSESRVPESKPLVGIALRPWIRQPSPDQYARAADVLARRANAHIVFVPMQHPRDVELSEAIAGAMGEPCSVIRRQLSPGEALAVTARLSGMFAMRLHALIFAAIAGIPMAALDYDPKVTSLMNRLGESGRCIPLARFDPETAATALVEAIEEGDSARNKLREKASEMSELALVNVDRAMALVAG